MNIKEIPKLLKKFWQSDKDTVSLVRDIVVALIAVFIVLMLLWTYTGQWFSAPMVAIESGSMEHPDEEVFGRLGFINAGDMVLVQKVYSYDDLITHGGNFGGAQAENDRANHRYGDWGDVIIYRPLGKSDVSQIIHRAMCWVEIDFVNETRQYSVREYGVINQESITIPELGLHKHKPSWDHSGYLTKGDNNAVIDQIGGICDQPIKLDWITGKARSEIPWLGTINLFFEDILHGKNTVANVHSDCLICLVIVIVILISIPIVLDFRDYIRKKDKK